MDKVLTRAQFECQEKKGQQQFHCLRAADAKDPFARLVEIQTEISPSSDEFVGLNIRPLVELTDRKEQKQTKKTHAHQDVR